MRVLLLALLTLTACSKAPTVTALTPAPEMAPVPQLVGGGSDVGSGGDSLAKDHLAAWFVGKDKVIHACVETDPTFGVTPEVAREHILKAFAMWKAYIEERAVHAMAPPAKQLSTEVKLDSKCDGTADLTFYLGVENDAVAKARWQFHEPTAFVQRLSYDPAQALGRGFIWVSRHEGIRKGFPDWNREGRLLAILLHEIGHVFGNDHVPGTVMTDGINRLLESDWSGEPLAKIDHCRELSPCLDCDYGAFVHPETFDSENAEFLKRVFGAKAEGKMMLAVSRNFVGNFLGLSIFEGEDLSRTGRFLLANRTTRPAFSSGAATFKVLHDGEILAGSDESFIQYSTIFAVTGGIPKKTGMLILEYNLSTCPNHWIDNRYPLEASIVDDDEQKSLASFDFKARHDPKNETIYP